MKSRCLSSSIAAALTFGLAACGDLKSAGQGEGAGPDAADAGPDAAQDAAPFDPARSGPGPRGSLPSGYCCNDDRECRYRRCVDTGGAAGKMCLDECFQNVFCTRPDITFTCAVPDAGGRGLCRPPAVSRALPPRSSRAA